MHAYLLLAAAIAVEVVGTTLMPRTQGFRDLPWTAVVLACYGMAFFLMSRVVETLPVYITYAVWAGMGTALVAAIGILVVHEPASLVRVLGIGLIVAGVVLVNWALPQG